MPASTKPHRSAPETRFTICRIGVGVDGFPEGRDAATLGAALAAPLDADLLLIAVHPEPIFVLPSGMDWTSQEEAAAATLRKVRDEIAPAARTMVKTDMWVGRALEHTARREHRDLMVLGSSRQAPHGKVRIGSLTRQLLSDAHCAIAVAPRGFATEGVQPLRRIGVGYDGSPESEAALSLASWLAGASGAELHLLAVVDDRMATSGFKTSWNGDEMVEWRKLVDSEESALKDRLDDAVTSSGARHAESVRGRPVKRLLEFSSTVGLLVLGSRRWGPVARVLLGSTGEALMHDAACPVLVAPRPHA